MYTVNLYLIYHFKFTFLGESSSFIAVTVSSFCFIVFLMLSPVFSKYMFTTDWSEELRKLHMNIAGSKEASNQIGMAGNKSLDDTNLSLREKQVVYLLLQGMTLRQVAPELGITFYTVSTYSKNIYKKLGINSKAELFILFGIQSADPSRASKLK